jgi:hypothetical protein
MDQRENPSFLTDRPMMGPDGAVYAVQTGTPKASSHDDLSAGSAPSLSQRPSEGGGGGEGGGCFHYSADVSQMDGGEASGCFRYSSDVPRRDGGTGPVCFSYSAAMPPSDRDAARRALRDVRRAPQGGVCFSYQG